MNEETVKYLTEEEIQQDEVYFVFDDLNDIEKAKYINALRARAKELRITREVNTLIKAWLDAEKQIKAEHARNRALLSEIPLKFDGKGTPLQTIENFLLVLNNDDKFKSLKFNELAYSPEHDVNGKAERWTDADDSMARNYLEKKHNLYHAQKYDDATRIKFKKNSYHPIKDIIESAEWDGVERVPTFLIKWLKCEDTAYTREVSRLIFAGGINRLYRPGCKFDDMPVLIGTKQGEGKSTLVRWLAIKDEWFREVGEIEGQKGIEAIEGGWICEMSELLALTRTKEVEAVKSYITKLVDTYRRPFDKRVTDHKRQCIFIGTTNKEQFLTDKTGNRRYYPVKVNQSGYELFDSEQEIKADILQCWAEAKAKYDKGEMKPYADRKLQKEIQLAQRRAVEEDYRDELIKDYLSRKEEVCIRELWQNALDNPEYTRPTRKDSSEISLIVQSTGEWEWAEGTKRFGSFGKTRYLSRSGTKNGTDEPDNSEVVDNDNPFNV